ncbi:MAG: carbamoyl-phosphate synthase (glutamine-hydrolyzing) large subunit [Patescibacteria group bacterium]|nr:carbamoyl-phosphate synthase (glutamine-hydrolyzing) large subunit [Patescibacteria group bacterium]
MKTLKKVLVLGSGALKIGEAGEFDYSGSQAMKALKEEGIKTVLVNPNIATIQTSPLLADEIYFLPVTPYFVEKVIAKEKPDGILLSFGGQTALNCGLELHRKGILKKHKVKVLGTPIEAVVLTEDRKNFADHLRKINVAVPPSGAAATLVQAQAIAKQIGFPVMVRAAYALGGQKSGVAYNLKQLNEIVSGALAVSPQVLVEKYLHHFKEIEYEVVRDKEGNCVTVCNMENMDPLGIHTGDSIVVAPSQTLTSDEYHGLREVSVNIVKSLGIVGECNVQFALNPNGSTQIKDDGSTRMHGHTGKQGLDYYVIEVNARLSRSSALASKATGYPLAYVAAKLALGKTLNKVQNQVTKVTQSFFEPALDYVVVKMPRWDLEKFSGAEEKIGSAMKSVGEVMAIGRSFEEALQKASRMLSGRVQGVTENGFNIKNLSKKEFSEKFLKIPTPKRLFALAESLKNGAKVKDIYQATGIDLWFLYRIKNIVDTEENLKASQMLDPQSLCRYKQAGLSDKRIAFLTGKTELEIRALRQKAGVLPSVFQIDTLAGEVPAQTNYLYLTYHGNHHDVQPLGKKSVMVLGSGPYHIGSSVEFDWSCVNTALALKKYDKKTIIINCNPETVSTDYDMSDRLYFEDLNFETVADILDFEQSGGVAVSVGGQRPNNLANALAAYKAPILGTSAENIDRAEDRNKFSALLDKLGILQPRWQSFASLEKAEQFAEEVGYPVLVRPSYVLSGSAMSVCRNPQQLKDFIGKAADLNQRHPVTVSKFIENAKELEFDAVAQNGELMVYAIAEHVENAGVHSGDATIVYPTQRVYASTEYQLRQIAKKISKELKITGPFNIQFLFKDNQPFVIEVNVRASRTFPLLSKALFTNFPAIAVDSFFGKAKKFNYEYPPAVVVKSPQFSFARLSGADPVLQVEMSSTGEVACFGRTYDEALLKSIMSANSFDFTKKRVLLSLGGELNKIKFLEAAQTLVFLGYEILATDTTASYLREQNVACTVVRKVSEQQPNVLNAIEGKDIAFVVNLSQNEGRQEQDKLKRHLNDGFRIRRAAVDNQIPLFIDLHLARAFVKALGRNQPDNLGIVSWQEYRREFINNK